MNDPSTKSNRLSRESSAYLRSAAHQAIDWYPWTKEAFSRAEREGKPVLLDIGASWCHWCHVMDEGTYGVAEISSYIDTNFIAVKVDRDERPDVDSRYQKAVSAMTGQGGWPLTVFLDASGRPFYGGTYFPPRQTGDMPGFLEVLKRIHSYYTTRESEREEVARSIAEAISSPERYDEENVGSAEVRAALFKIVEEADTVNGGFGYAPKFPHTSAIELLMTQLSRGRKDAHAPLKLTLDSMLAGGIHDHLGGGFHRYSTDEKWIVPHFEKMAYDNAGLLKNYVHAFQITGDREYMTTAEGTAAFLTTTLGGEEGFYSSQDADASPGDDGDYWTWSPAELSATLEGDEKRVAELYFHIHGMAEMHRKDRHVLYRAMSADEISGKTGIGREAVGKLLNSAREKMLAARTARPTPLVDKSIFGNWNGMVASALSEYYRVAGGRAVIDSVRRGVMNFIGKAYSPGKGFCHTIGGNGIWGMLDDQVNMLHAALDLFELTSDPSLAGIVKNAAVLVEGYRSGAGGLNDVDESVYSGEKIGLSDARSVPVYDTPAQSPNSSAALLLQRVAAVFDDGKAAEGARKTVCAVAPSCLTSGAYASSIFLAVDQMVNEIPVVVVVGSGSDVRLAELAGAAGRVYLPGKETVLVDVDCADAGVYPATIQSMIQKARESGRPLAYSCRGRSCSLPIEDPEKLTAALGQ